MSEPSLVTAENLFVEAADGVTYAYRRFGNTTSTYPPLGPAPLPRQPRRVGPANGRRARREPRGHPRRQRRRGAVARAGAANGHRDDPSRDRLPRRARADRDRPARLLAGRLHRAGARAAPAPQLVRRLVLAATGPQGGGAQMHGWITDVAAVANAADNGPAKVLWLFFSPSESSKQKGMEYLQRFSQRQEDRDKPNGTDVGLAQYDAVVEWGIPDPSKLNRLAGITQPTLVANGDNDTMIPTENCHILARHLPNARVRIFADAGHGFLYQYPTEFAELIGKFLASC